MLATQKEMLLAALRDGTIATDENEYADMLITVALMETTEANTLRISLLNLRQLPEITPDVCVCDFAHCMERSCPEYGHCPFENHE